MAFSLKGIDLQTGNEVVVVAFTSGDMVRFGLSGSLWIGDNVTLSLG